MQIFIKGNVPSSKNSKVATKNGVFMSKTVRKYLQSLGVKNYSVGKKTVENYKTRPNLFTQAITPMFNDPMESPHVIGLYFIRDSRRKFDFLNVAQVVCDLLVAHRVFVDDNMDCVIPMAFRAGPGFSQIWKVPVDSWYCVDKARPGVVIDF